MNILLINPAYSIHGGIKGMGGSMVPLNLCYLASYCRMQHPDFKYKILDAELLGLSHAQTLAEIDQYRPDLIGITTNTSVFDTVITLTKLIKREIGDSRIVLGGPHVSALPAQSIAESGADFVVCGEGELTFAELAHKIHLGQNDFETIAGLVWKDAGGEVLINPKRELKKNIDEFPFPARDLVDNSLYTPPPTKRVSLGPNTLIATSRGCPHNCGFCGAKTVWTKRIRTRTPECVVAEIKECIDKYGIRSFNFTDEYFTANKKRVNKFCELLIKEKVDITWVCSSRAERLDMATLQAMKRAGCKEISFGIESGSPQMLEKIDKALDLKEAERVIKLAKKVGITTHASYILGYLGETKSTIKETIRVAKRFNTHVAAFFIASPLPGTQLFFDAQAQGRLREDATWFDYSPLSNSKPVLESENFTIDELKAWRKKALRDYYFRPRYILLRLFSIRHFYEIVNLVGGLRIFFNIRK